jgi:cyanoexosortase B
MDKRIARPTFLETQLGNLLIGGLLALIYGPILLHWVDGWLKKSISIDHEYFSHGLIGLHYAAYLIFVVNSKPWQALDNRFHPLGAFFLTLGSLLYLAGTLYSVNLSFPVVLTGLFLSLKGIPGIQLNRFPLLIIFLATPNPLPYLITPFTLPLQIFIAGVAGFILMHLGMDVTVDQMYLLVNGRAVEVAPYCAGLKMLFTSLYVTLILLHWTGNLKSRSRTLFMLLSASIISVFANIARNTLLASFHGANNNKAFEWLHEGWGGDVYSILMLLTIIFLNQNLDRLGFVPIDNLNREKREENP